MRIPAALVGTGVATIVGAGAVVAGAEDPDVVALVSAGVAFGPPEHAARSATAQVDASLRIPHPKLGDIAAIIRSPVVSFDYPPVKVPVAG